MGDTSGTDRHMAGGIDAFDDDPFAELARLIDEPWNAPQAQRPAKSDRPVAVAASQPKPAGSSTDDVGATARSQSQQTPAAAHQSQPISAEMTMFVAQTRNDSEYQAPPPETAQRSNWSTPAAGPSAPIGSSGQSLSDPVAAPTAPVPAEKNAIASISGQSETAKGDFDFDFASDLDSVLASELGAELASLDESDLIGSRAQKPAATSMTAAKAQQKPVKPIQRGNPQPAAFSAAALDSAKTGPSQPRSAAPVEKPAVPSVPSVDPAARRPEQAVFVPRAPEPVVPATGAAALGASISITPGLSGATSKPAGNRKDETTFEQEFAEALAGLSAPADPRAGRINKTHAFAPAREEEVVEAPRGVSYDDFDALLASEMAALKAAQPVRNANATPQKAMSVAEHQASEAGLSAPGAGRGVADFSADEPAKSRPVAANRNTSLRRIAASVAIVALASGAGWMMFSGAGETAGDGGPLIVKADADPVKIVPPNPGGREVANQDSPTYRAVASRSEQQTAPEQQTLVSSAEEPVALPERQETDYENLPGVEMAGLDTALDSGESVEVASAEPQSGPILMPRRVKSVKVLPDGTIVSDGQATAEPALIEAATRPIDADGAISDLETAATVPAEETSAGSAEVQTEMAGEALGQPAPNVPVPSAKPPVPSRRVAEPARQPASSWPDEMRTASVEPARPAQTPVAAPVQPASAAPSPSGWYVQISSQPSEEAARTSARTMSSRYASVLGGRNLVIQTAEIEGKGTYHRVRLPAGSKDEANALCSNLKSAGGSCFVSR